MSSLGYSIHPENQFSSVFKYSKFYKSLSREFGSILQY